MKELWKDLWKDKPLLITLGVGLVAVLYILYRSNSANVVAPSGGTGTSTGDGSIPNITPVASGGGNGTYVEESYSYYAPASNTSTTTSTITNPPAPTAPPVTIKPVATPKIIAPAAKGSLNGTQKSAGKSDTNFWVYTVPAGATIASLTQFAKWGSNTSQLTNYRNNLQILQAAGVNTSNPLAPVPAGLKISV